MKGSVEQRSKGSWRIRYDGGITSDGKRRQVSETVRGTKKDAERVLRERLAAMDNGLPPASQKETLSEFMDRWLSDHVAHTTRPRTQQFYRTLGAARAPRAPDQEDQQHGQAHGRGKELEDPASGAASCSRLEGNHKLQITTGRCMRANLRQCP